MFNFIQRKNPNLVEILDIKLKEDDDEYGAIGEHYVVKCSLKVLSSSSTSNNVLVDEEQTCLVNVLEFQKWARKEDSIIWI